MIEFAFSWYMILAYFIVLNMWIMLLFVLNVNTYWIILNPLNIALIFNVLYGVGFQLKKKISIE